jgi:prophage DNA circulation protein
MRSLERTPLGAVLRALVAEERDDVLSRVLADVEGARRRLLRTVLETARDRGEIGRDRDLELDIDILLGAAYVRTLVRRAAAERTLAERIVDTWLSGAARS